MQPEFNARQWRPVVSAAIAAGIIEAWYQEVFTEKGQIRTVRWYSLAPEFAYTIPSLRPPSRSPWKVGDTETFGAH